jgi:hypothetical protein
VTAGTIFQDLRTPLSTWFRAMWWLTTASTSEIGRSVDQPRVAHALVHLAPGAVLADVAAATEAMIASELAQLPAFCRDVAADMHVRLMQANSRCFRPL